MAAVAPPPPPDPVDDAPPLPAEPPPPAPSAQDDISGHLTTAVQHYGAYYGQAAPYASSYYGAPTHTSYPPAHAYYGQYAPQQQPSYAATGAQWAPAYAAAPGAAAQPFGAYPPAYGAPPPAVPSAQPSPYQGGGAPVAPGAYGPSAPAVLAPPAPLPAPGGVTFSLPARPRPVAPGAVHTSGATLDDPRRVRRHFGDGPQLVPNTKTNHDAEAQGRQALSNWVQRAFARYPSRTDELREKIKLVLKPFVDSATQWQHDWDREPMPELGSSDGSAASHLAVHETSPRRDSPPLGGVRRRPPPYDSSHEQPHKRHAPALRIQPQGKKLSRKAAKAAAAQQQRARADAQHTASLAARVDAREARFQSSRRGAGGAPASDDDDDDEWQPSVIVQGRCTDLEKDFLRLNGPPDAAKVRPEAVIRAALERLVGMIARGEGEYRYHWSQLKAMRQDLIVQHLQNETAAAVEEVFARRALEHGDMRNYQKCSTALRVLFDAGVRGSRAEFDAYRILANVCQAHCTSDELLKSIKEATAHGVGAAPEVRHALRVHAALVMGNSRGFWKLYESAPHCGRLIMDRAAPAVRLDAIKALASRFRPAAGQAFCLAVLGFDLPPRRWGDGEPLQAGCCQEQRALESEDVQMQERVRRCRECLLAYKAVVSAGERGQVEVRAKENKVDQIVMPDEKDMKGHGHAAVSLTDFKKAVM